MTPVQPRVQVPTWLLVLMLLGGGGGVAGGAGQLVPLLTGGRVAAAAPETPEQADDHVRAVAQIECQRRIGEALARNDADHEQIRRDLDRIGGQLQQILDHYLQRGLSAPAAIGRTP